ncbi:hypothetical protein K493DRAFT_320297 [Basidiobolus meristosporus CBS 931.73]|uniref:Ribonucleases P/MRP subunit Pop8-like domain-containing protein n=1 Tax=Basidiobolus meristosporus CBS 931.73 TaxID=1314790 RepID=A0A1Y1XBS4_9FUNG|nr:hypothetical protein K493DRAFT_320297 [Basidiobolus meristosporus CBS 931.73]|eukprot:ORX83199.1 hypothetical protein K493DRAFT_320297 [Basidiobolus meristosporus CBS 931.73]
MDLEPTMAKKTPAFQRLAISTSQWQYLKIQVAFEDIQGASSHSVDELLFRSFIVQALTSLHGLVGSAMQVDVLSLDGLVGVIKVANEDLPALWSALTLYQGIHQGNEFQFRVLSVSAYLLGLASNSRAWDI